MKKEHGLIIGLLVFLIFISLFILYSIVKPKGIVPSGDKVAVIPLYGEITLEGGGIGSNAVTPDKFGISFKEACSDPSVKAIVLEINSPGGSVVASEAIAEQIKECKKKKPVIAWLGDIATSGAYYVASACTYIVADKASITGSIGVISIFPEYSELLHKLGINVTIIKAGKYKDFSYGLRPMTDEEKKMISEMISDIYDDFIETVAENRNLSKEYVKELAEGRVYSGKKAKELGLVDEIGTKERAIKKAAELAGIEGKPSVVTYRKRSIIEEILGNSLERLGQGIAEGIAKQKIKVE